MDCSICLDGFKDPRILPCGHTFCEMCLKTLIKNDCVQCPECRVLFKAKNKKFPKNISLAHLIQEYDALLKQKNLLEVQIQDIKTDANKLCANCTNQINQPEFKNFNDRRPQINSVPYENKPQANYGQVNNPDYLRTQPNPGPYPNYYSNTPQVIYPTTQPYNNEIQIKGALPAYPYYPQQTYYYPYPSYSNYPNQY
jgi:Zinc finger, C3HC4 type (RING finger)